MVRPLIPCGTQTGRTSRHAVFSALLLLGCGDGGPTYIGPPPAEMHLGVFTSEAEPARALMIIGEAGRAAVTVYSSGGLGIVPRAAAVGFASSDADVVRVTDLGIEARLDAVAPGSVRITAQVEHLTDTAHIDVTAAPLPLDGIRVSLEKEWNDLSARYDATSSLTWLEVPTGQSGALNIVGMRSGVGVHLPWNIASDDPSVAVATLGCRPPSMDPHCDVASTAWITGVTSGDAVVTVSARNASTTFTAHVVAAP